MGMHQEMRRHVLPHMGLAFVGIAAAWLIVYGGPVGIAAVACGALGLFVFAWTWTYPSVLRIELPIALLLLSTLVLRARDHEALAENPLDPAGIYRVTAVGLAVLLSCITLIHASRRVAPAPFKVYGLYVLSVFIAVPLSLYPEQTAYRGIELLAGVLTFLAIWRFYGPEGIQRAGRVLFGFLVASLEVVWAEIALLPIEVQRIPGSVLPFRIGGYVPSVSANDVGLYGVLLFLWCLARLTDERPVAHPMRLRLMALFGLVSLVGAQYRTGYICAVLGLLIIGFARRAYKLAFAGIAVVCLVLLIWPELIAITDDVQQVWRRGEPAGMTPPTISGRMDWWDAAIPVWQESPVFGKGLITATRFEVLAPMGAIPSTIHNGWIEALVGTGLLGVALLIAAILKLGKRTIQRLHRHECTTLVLLSVLLVRSLTGSSFEIFGFGALLFMFLCFVTTERES